MNISILGDESGGNEKARNHCRLQAFPVTELEGFEPSNAGVKVLCLTAWRQPNSNLSGIVNYLATIVKNILKELQFGKWKRVRPSSNKPYYIRPGIERANYTLKHCDNWFAQKMP